MNNIKEAVALGRDQAVGHLMSIAGGCQGLTHVEAEERQKIATQLRHLATLVEAAPEHVAGLVLLAGEKVFGDTEGINNCVMITGSAPFIAAAHLQLEDHGRDALNDCMPALIREALSQVLGVAEDEEAAPQSPAQPS